MSEDEIFRRTAAAYPAHMIERIALASMWNEIGHALGHAVTFMSDNERERLRA